MPSTFYRVYLVKDGNFFRERNKYYNVIRGTESEVFLHPIISWTNANVGNVSFDNWPMLAVVERDTLALKLSNVEH